MHKVLNFYFYFDILQPNYNNISLQQQKTTL